MTREEAIKILRVRQEYATLIKEQVLQEAIDIAIEALENKLTADEELQMWKDAQKLKDRITDLEEELLKYKSADRPKGEWVRIWASEYETCPLSRCSNCNEEYPSIADNYNYCPICGADMKGGDDE